jgi:hypothetical protein
VLSNDLFEAVNRADHQNKESFVDIVTYIYDHCPSNCWGSRDIVNQWLEQKNLSNSQNRSRRARAIKQPAAEHRLIQNF